MRYLTPPEDLPALRSFPPLPPPIRSGSYALSLSRDWFQNLIAGFARVHLDNHRRPVVLLRHPLRKHAHSLEKEINHLSGGFVAIAADDLHGAFDAELLCVSRPGLCNAIGKKKENVSGPEV